MKLAQGFNYPFPHAIPLPLQDQTVLLAGIVQPEFCFSSLKSLRLSSHLSHEPSFL